MPVDEFRISGTESLSVVEGDPLTAIRENLNALLNPKTASSSSQLDKDLYRARAIIINGKNVIDEKTRQELRNFNQLQNALTTFVRYALTEEEKPLIEEEKEKLRQSGDWDFKRDMTEDEEKALLLIKEKFPKETDELEKQASILRDQLELIRLQREILGEATTMDAPERKEAEEKITASKAKIELAKSKIQEIQKALNARMEPDIEDMLEPREAGIEAFKAMNDQDRKLNLSRLNTLHQGQMAIYPIFQSNYTFRGKVIANPYLDPALIYEKNDKEYTFALQTDVYAFMDTDGSILALNKQGLLERVVLDSAQRLDNETLKKKGYQLLFTIDASSKLDLSNGEKPRATTRVKVESKVLGLRYNGSLIDPAVVTLGNISFLQKVKRAVGLVVDFFSGKKSVSSATITENLKVDTGNTTMVISESLFHRLGHLIQYLRGHKPIEQENRYDASSTPTFEHSKEAAKKEKKKVTFAGVEVLSKGKPERDNFKP